MKTTFRTLAAVVTLLLIVATSNNASAHYRRFMYWEFNHERENSLSVEDWMIDEDFWTPKSTIETIESERPLKVESWMTNENLWK